MNKIHLIGNLTRDPELTTTPNHINVCRFSIAVGRKFENANGEKETDFFNVVAWRGLGESAHKFLSKGKKVAVCGSLQIRNYEDKEGIKRQAVEVIAEDIEFLTPRSIIGEEEPAEKNPPKNKQKAKTIEELEEIEDDGDLPF